MTTLAAAPTTGKSIRVLERNTAGQPLAAAIHDGKETCHYDILLIESVEDGVLYRIKKTSGKRDIGAIYDVFIAADSPTCDCPGFVYKGKCKHCPAFTSLTISEGQRRPSRPACNPARNNTKPVVLAAGERHCRDCEGTGWKRVNLDAKQSVFRCDKCDGHGTDLPF